MPVTAWIAAVPTVPLPLRQPPVVVEVLTDLMLLCWLAAFVLAIWGSIREGRRVEREQRHVEESDPLAGPTPAIDGILDHWGVWSLTLVGAGLVLLAIGAAMAGAG